MTRNAGPLIALGAILAASPASAADCRAALAQAAAAHSVPYPLLEAVGYVESGHDPLAINADGDAYHPSSLEDAIRLVRKLQSGGAKYIDLGCAQIDLHYHPDAFPDLAAAFDPAANADYAARLLLDNKTRYGSWTGAAAFYHSADPTAQAAYVGHLKAHMTGEKVQQAPAPAACTPRMITVHLTMMTIQRPVAGGKPC